ncbi:hypothetical protein BGZ92_004673 [Podila epicladia]|nr:hypothetical protein BGZ92_004673 [Podila epicladia]
MSRSNAGFHYNVVVGTRLQAETTGSGPSVPQDDARVDLSKAVLMTSIECSNDITRVLEEEHAKPLDFTNHSVPLWRITISHATEDDSFYIFYVYCHNIADGRSGVALMEQLVEGLNFEATSASPTETLPMIVSSPTASMPESLENRANW